MCSRLTSLAVPGSLKSFFACFGVLRRSATHDARAHTPIPSLCKDRRACGRDVLSSEVKRSEASHERDNHRVRWPCGRDPGSVLRNRTESTETWSKLFLHVNQTFTYRPELSESDRIELHECNSHSPVYLPKRACNMVTPSLLLLYSPGHVVLRGFFMASR